MSNAWKLVEAEPIVQKPSDSTRQQQDNWNRNRKAGQNGNRGGGRKPFNNNGRRDGNRSRERRYQDDGYYGGIYIPDTPESRTYYAKVAVYNIEMLFNVESLCRDTFLRAYMDEAGYIPIPFLCNYISSFGVNYQEIVTLLQESETLEVDVPNETVRLKENWQMWLIPNGEGGMGLPKYVKQPLPPMADPAGEYYYDYQNNVYYDAQQAQAWEQQQQNQWYGNGDEAYYVDENGQVILGEDGYPIPIPPNNENIDDNENIDGENSTPTTLDPSQNSEEVVAVVVEEESVCVEVPIVDSNLVNIPVPVAVGDDSRHT
eukprot:gene9402-19508_t